MFCAAAPTLPRHTELSVTLWPLADIQISCFDRNELVQDLVHPALEEAQDALVEVFEEMEGQLDKEAKRLVELHRIRIEDPGE